MTPQDIRDLEHRLQLQINTRASADEAFRRQVVMSQPNKVQELLERELGFTLPAGVTLQVHQGIPFTIHLIVPENPPAS